MVFNNKHPNIYKTEHSLKHQEEQPGLRSQRMQHRTSNSSGVDVAVKSHLNDKNKYPGDINVHAPEERGVKEATSVSNSKQWQRSVT